MISVGVDVGSNTTKAAAVGNGRVLATHLLPTGYHAEKAGRLVFEILTSEAGIAAADIAAVVATGYGRSSVTFADRAVTEITCHAAGAHYLNPAVRSVIDIGGQDSKAIVMGADGRVRDFAMNDKCAAGTGRFLEVMARALEVDLEQFGNLALQAPQAAPISSLCTVFAESEVISLIAKGEPRPHIIAGIHEAIGSRVAAMALRIGVKAPLMMTGGVARNQAVVRALSQKLGHPVEVSPLAQLTGAIGAALIAGQIESPSAGEA
jgi:predicted CoA-substrate-specific enzyme activase